jgi:hypothetical protein
MGMLHELQLLLLGLLPLLLVYGLLLLLGKPDPHEESCGLGHTLQHSQHTVSALAQHCGLLPPLLLPLLLAQLMLVIGSAWHGVFQP